MVVFSNHNVACDRPISRLDLLSCRNVMIYLEPELQKKLLSTFNYALNPEGVLFLGTAETIGLDVDAFRILDSKWRIYQARKAGKPPL